MKKFFSKILFLVISVIIILLTMNTVVLAVDKINPSDWNPIIKNPLKTSNKFNNLVGLFLGIIKNVGIVVSVLSLSFIGLKTMFGSLEEKSHYKELLPSFIIGIILLVGCTTIPYFIYTIAR